MTIGIEAERANHPQKTGVEHYAKQLIEHLAKIDSVNRYVLYLRTRPEPWFLNLPKNFRVKVIPFPIFWTQIRISWEMLVNPVDVLFIPASALPVIHPKKSVSTIHDLAWNFFPETYTTFIRYFSIFFTWYAVKFCSKIIAVSQATKDDIVKKYGVSPEKIAVVHHGYDVVTSDKLPTYAEASDFAKASSDKPAGRQVTGLVLPEKYVLFLSTLQPRKNLEKLIDEFRHAKLSHPEIPHKLLVVGKPGWKFTEILKKINQNKDIVVYLNHISETQKAQVLAKADLLVLPSLYEGFGMQILEAFAANVPVATSNISSMPEVAGQAAVYFDPKSTGDIARAMQMVLHDQSLSDSLRAKGRDRLKDFSWDKCARETLDVLTKMT